VDHAGDEALVYAARGVLAPAMLAAAAATIIPLGAKAAHADLAGAGKKISQGEVIARAQDWFQQTLTYSQYASHDDVDGTPYRTDCSGYVSMAWHLSSVPDSATLATSAHSTVLVILAITSSDRQAGECSTIRACRPFLFARGFSSDHSQGFRAPTSPAMGRKCGAT